MAIGRSEGMVKIAYFVFRYSGDNAAPEEFRGIGLNTRNAVFEACFDALHDGRSNDQFLNSMEGDYGGYCKWRAGGRKDHPQRRFLKDFIPPHDRRKLLWSQIQQYFPVASTPSPAGSAPATACHVDRATPRAVPRMDVDDEGIEDDAEFEIQNLTREVQVRQRQSLFRQRVMENFGGRCCLSGISEPCLLIASHIVPWSVSVEKRLNPRNGILLNSMLDKMFDRGLISFENDLSVIVIDWVDDCSQGLQELLVGLIGRKAAHPRILPSPDFLDYHRNVVLKRDRPPLSSDDGGLD